MAGTIGVDVVQTGSVGLPPAFRDSAGTETGQLCRAWVNFNGVTTVSVRGSFNVSSVTRNSTGNYTIAFSTSMPDANYSTVGCGTYSNTEAWSLAALTTGTTASGVNVITKPGGITTQDLIGCYVAIFR